MQQIVEITQSQQKQKICRQILEALSEWFEVEESREQYISECVNFTFIAAEDNGYAGFLCLKQTGKATVEIAVMGVLKEFHRKGIGRALVQKAVEIARQKGYTFMQVKTVAEGYYEDYDRTNKFYQSCGFKELEIFPLFWDQANPCQVYVMYLPSPCEP